LFRDLQNSGKYNFIFKLHPTCFHLEDYDLEYPPSLLEFNNLKFIHKTFTVTSEEEPCLLPFFEAFETIICDLHSTVGFIAQYFSPRIIIAYHNDAYYEVPHRDERFLANLSIFDEINGLRRFLCEAIPEKKGNSDFFKELYGVVDGHEVDKFAKNMGWESRTEMNPFKEYDWNLALDDLTRKWTLTLQEAQKRLPTGDFENWGMDCTMAIGIDVHKSNPNFALNDLNNYQNQSLNKQIPKLQVRKFPPNQNLGESWESFQIMTFNIWNGGESHPAKYSIKKTASVILQCNADIVALQETAGLQTPPYSHGSPDTREVKLGKLVAALNKLSPGKETWSFYDQGIPSPSTGCLNPTGIISRFPIIQTSPGKYGVLVEVPGGAKVWVFNTHLAYFPYQPYQIVGIPYENCPPINTEREAIESARKSRSWQIDKILADIESLKSFPQNDLIMLCGDFNEPSHLDWQAASVLSGQQPFVCEWPSTLRFQNEGNFHDAYRAFHPSVLERPGYTWTPRKATFGIPRNEYQTFVPEEKHDRIDFILIQDRKQIVVVQNASVVGPKYEDNGKSINPSVDIAVCDSIEEYPSDHCAVLVQIAINKLLN
jgi:endonuclease/exonuclease/phosphatase family metal-dependent hydrolase